MYRKKLDVIWLTLILLGFFLSSARSLQSQDDIGLAWKFGKGQKFEFEVNQTSELESEVETVSNVIKTTNSVRFQWHVKAVDNDGTAEITMVFTSIKVDVQLPTPTGTRSFVIDTDSDESLDELESEMKANLDAVIGSEIRLSISKQGALNSMELPAEAKAKLRQAPQSMQIRQLVTESGIAELLGASRMVFPAEAMKTGFDWSTSENFTNSIGSFTREQKMTFEGIQLRKSESLSKILVETRLVPIEVDASENPQDGASNETAEGVGGIEIKSQSGVGTIWFDHEKGFLRASGLVNELSTQTPYREMKINIKMNSKIDLEVFQVD